MSLIDGEGAWWIHSWVSAWWARMLAVAFLTLIAEFVLRFALLRLWQRTEKTTNPWDQAVVQALRAPASLAVLIVGLSFSLEIGLRAQEQYLWSSMPVLRELVLIVALNWFLFALSRRLEIAYRTYLKGIVSPESSAPEPTEPSTAETSTPEPDETNTNKTTNDASTSQASLSERASSPGSEPDANTSRRLTEETILSLGKLFRVTVLCISTLMVLQTLGVSISGLLAFGGVGSIVMGFAARDTLANLLAGVLVSVDRPFSESDWVRSPDRDIEGIVENIGWRVTKIRRFDMRPIYVPNSVFSSIVVENPTRMSHWRIQETIGLRYQDLERMPAVIAEFQAVLHADPRIDTDHRYLVFTFYRFGDSSLEIRWIAYTKRFSFVEFRRIKQELLFILADIVAKHEAEFAFPTSSVYLENAEALQAEPTRPTALPTPLLNPQQDDRQQPNRQQDDLQRCPDRQQDDRQQPNRQRNDPSPDAKPNHAR